MTQASIPAPVPRGRQEHLDGLAVSLLLGCCLFWGFQQVLVKATIAEVAPVFQAAIRFAGATFLLWLWCVWRGVRLFGRDGTLGAGLAAGALFAAEFACMYVGLQYTSASRLTVFLYTSPFWVAALLPLFVPAERMRAGQWIGMALAFAGVAFALRDGFRASSPPLQWFGDLLAIAAGMLWGLTTVVIRSTSLVRVSAEKLLFYQVALSSAALPLLSLALGEAWVWQFSAFAATSLFLQAAIGAFASYLAWMWMLGYYPATKLSVFSFLTPVFALVIGAMWLHERISPSLLVAMVLAALGIVLVNRKPRRVTAQRQQ
ncbi:MAG: DMT family transporter [Burkholderiales bacterium]